MQVADHQINSFQNHSQHQNNSSNLLLGLNNLPEHNPPPIMIQGNIPASSEKKGMKDANGKSLSASIGMSQSMLGGINSVNIIQDPSI